MRSRLDLENILHRIDGRGYRAYRDIEGEYDFEDYRLLVDHAQPDPFASPSRVRVVLSSSRAGFPEATYADSLRRIALRDYLTRRFREAIGRRSSSPGGTGKGGEITMDRCGQEILERSAVVMVRGEVEARFRMGLPAFGRRIAARTAHSMFFADLPRIVRAALVYSNLDEMALERHLNTAEDAEALRGRLRDMGRIAFLADGAVLPRASGVDPRPLGKGPVVELRSPESLRVSVDLPHGGRISGMGIPPGVTLIVGGGYHGKSTLLKAL